MEETGKWIVGVILSISALVSTWLIAKSKGNKDAHKDLYKKLDDLERRKANDDFVKEELKKVNENLNTRMESHIHESTAANELILNAMSTQADLIKSIDGNVKILIQKLK